MDAGRLHQSLNVTIANESWETALGMCLELLQRNMDDLEAHNKLFEIIGKLGLQSDLSMRANAELR